MARVSICIPAYQNNDGVVRLLDSLKQQTFQDYEVIVSDDSPDDRLCEIVKKYPKTCYYHNKVRLGATANWNAAVERSSGSYIKIMHHDDWFTDSKALEQFVRLLDENEEAVLAFSGSRQVSGNCEEDRCIRQADAELIRADYRNLFLGNTIGAPSAVIYRRSNNQFDEALTWLVDSEFYMGLLRKGTFAYTARPLVSIGISRNQLTEQCRDDGELNAREYGHIYDKYELGIVKAYRKKMTRILADGGRPFSEAKEHGISGGEFLSVKSRKLAEKILWKLGYRPKSCE